MRLPALATAGLLAVTLTTVPALPAVAKQCRPATTERALEELLDVAADGSQLEHEARRIADEADTRGAFDAAETLRQLDDLAVANGLAYDCAARLYRPVAGPDPRQEIEEGGFGVEDAEPLEDSTSPPPTPNAPTPATAGPGASGGTGGATPGADGTPPGEGDGPASGEAAGSIEANLPDGAARRGQGTGTGRNTGTATGGDRSASGEVETQSAHVDDVAVPGATPEDSGGVATLPGDPGPSSSTGRAIALAALGASALAAVVAASASTRRRRGRQLL